VVIPDFQTITVTSSAKKQMDLIGHSARLASVILAGRCKSVLILIYQKRLEKGNAQVYSGLNKINTGPGE
jgi:hypothetical protein